MAAFGGINHPKSVCGKTHNARKQKKAKKAAKIKKAAKRSVDPLTTSHILRKTKTNPSANIALSGKKRRLLLKQLKREGMEKQKMDQDVVIVEKPKTKSRSEKTNNYDNSDKMDMT